MAAEDLRIAIVGCGDIARFVALSARLQRRVAVVACCDIDAARARQFARRHRIPQVFTVYEEMLAQVPLAAVYLAVPHFLHAEMIQKAVGVGCAVFVEKPITRTLAEGIAVTRLAQSAGVRVGVNYQYRYDRGCYALARAVQQGKLGAIRYAHCQIPWHRGESYFTAAPWHATLAAAGGGTLITQASHLLDVLLWAIGKRPLHAQGVTAQRHFHDVEVEDLALGTVELEDGILVQISSSMVAVPEQAVSMTVYGERGTAVYTNSPWPRVTFRGVRIRHARPPHWGVHALQRSFAGFCAWLQEDIPYLTPAVAALPALAVVETIYEAAATGSWQPVANWQEQLEQSRLD